ncbi:MAG: hypothetical protein ACK4SN_13845, partial [Bellilinea sp.]
RRAWLPVLLIIGLIGLIFILFGAGDWLLFLVEPINRIFSSIGLVFVFSLLLHVGLILPFWLLRKLLSKITGLEVI